MGSNQNQCLQLFVGTRAESVNIQTPTEIRGFSTRRRWPLEIGGLLLIAASFLLNLRAGIAAEPTGCLLQCEGMNSSRRTVCLPAELSDIPILMHIPYVGRVFRLFRDTPDSNAHHFINVGSSVVDDSEIGLSLIQQSVPQNNVVADANWERIGIDFDIDQASYNKTVCSASCPEARADELNTAATKTCSTAGACASACSTCRSSNCALAACVAKSEAECVACAQKLLERNESRELPNPTVSLPSHVVDELMELVASHAEVEAVLHVREEMAKMKDEFMQQLLETTRETGELQAKLQVQLAREEMRHEMLELLNENAKLKARLEFASDREDLERSAAKLSLENDSLRQQVAALQRELEETRSLGPVPTRTARARSRKSASAPARTAERF